MKAEINWLDDPEVFRVNRLPAHSDHRFYKSMEEMEEGRSSLEQSLNGMSGTENSIRTIATARNSPTTVPYAVLLCPLAICRTSGTASKTG